MKTISLEITDSVQAEVDRETGALVQIDISSEEMPDFTATAHENKEFFSRFQKGYWDEKITEKYNLYKEEIGLHRQESF